MRVISCLYHNETQFTQRSFEISSGNPLKLLPATLDLSLTADLVMGAMEAKFAKPVPKTTLYALKEQGINPLLEPQKVAPLLTEMLENAAGSAALRALRRFMRGADSYLLMKHVFDVGELPVTPQSLLASGDSSWYYAGYAALTLVSVAGLQPVSYKCENKGELIVNLTALPGMGKLSEKSRAAMRGHTDACSFPFAHEFQARSGISPSPDFVILIGLRNPDLIPTCVAPLSKIMKQLPEWAIDELKKPQFSIGSQNTFRTPHILEAAAVLTIHPRYGYQVRFSHRKVAADMDNNVASEAVEAMAKATADCLEDVVVAPGDILFVNNRTALHGRREVGGDIGGETRWLQRMYGNLPDTVGAPVDPKIPFCWGPEEEDLPPE